MLTKEPPGPVPPPFVISCTAQVSLRIACKSLICGRGSLLENWLLWNMRICKMCFFAKYVQRHLYLAVWFGIKFSQILSWCHSNWRCFAHGLLLAEMKKLFTQLECWKYRCQQSTVLKNWTKLIIVFRKMHWSVVNYTEQHSSWCQLQYTRFDTECRLDICMTISSPAALVQNKFHMGKIPPCEGIFSTIQEIWFRC